MMCAEPSKKSHTKTSKARIHPKLTSYAAIIYTRRSKVEQIFSLFYSFIFISFCGMHFGFDLVYQLHFSVYGGRTHIFRQPSRMAPRVIRFSALPWTRKLDKTELCGVTSRISQLIRLSSKFTASAHCQIRSAIVALIIICWPVLMLPFRRV